MNIDIHEYLISRGFRAEIDGNPSSSHAFPWFSLVCELLEYEYEYESNEYSYSREYIHVIHVHYS